MDSNTKAQKQEIFRSRALSKPFFDQFKDGIFKPLVDRVRLDKDLDLEFRGTYINVYYQGHSILNLHNNGNVKIDTEFKLNLNLPEKLKNKDHVATFLAQMPQIKDNVVYRPQKENENRRISRSREVEFEQLLIRANNLERRNNSDYIIIDRQYVVNNGKDRWDLIALRYPPKGNNPKGYLSIIEIKYAQNPDIKDIKLQVERYAEYLEKYFPCVCSDMTEVLKQKLELGLIVRSQERIEWLKRLCLNKAIDKQLASAEIIVYLIDHNSYSNLKKLAEEHGKPKFSGKVLLALGGLALWQANLSDFGSNDKSSGSLGGKYNV